MGIIVIAKDTNHKFTPEQDTTQETTRRTGNLPNLKPYIQPLKEYYEIVDKARPLSGFFPTHADLFTQRLLSSSLVYRNAL